MINIGVGITNMYANIQGMQGTMNQMAPPMPQGHFMNMNNPQGGAPPGGLPNGLQSMQGPPNASGNQLYQQGGAFNRPQAAPLPPMPGLNPFQVMFLSKHSHSTLLRWNHYSHSTLPIYGLNCLFTFSVDGRCSLRLKVIDYL